MMDAENDHEMTKVVLLKCKDCRNTMQVFCKESSKITAARCPACFGISQSPFYDVPSARVSQHDIAEAERILRQDGRWKV